MDATARVCCFFLILPSKSLDAPAGFITLLGPCEPGRWSARTCPCRADIVLSFRRRKATKRSPTSAGCLKTLYDELSKRRPSSHLVTDDVALLLSAPPSPSDVTVRSIAVVVLNARGAYVVCCCAFTLHNITPIIVTIVILFWCLVFGV